MYRKLNFNTIIIVRWFSKPYYHKKKIGAAERNPSRENLAELHQTCLR